MDCFGLCRKSCCHKEKKTQAKYKKKLHNDEKNMAHPTQNDQEMKPPSDNDPQPVTFETPPPVAITEDKAPNQSVARQHQIIGNGETTEGTRIRITKENGEKLNRRSHHRRQVSSDSESDSTSDDSSSSDDSPDEKIAGKNKGTNSKTTIINAKGGIVSLGKHNKSKIVHISYGVEKADKNKRRKKKSSQRSHEDENPENMALRHHNEIDNCLGNFRKMNDETAAVYDLKLILKIAESVGIIRSPCVTGTGFRVGDSYIMTARHVVMDIIKSVPQRLEQPTEDRVKILEDPTIYIDFDYELPDGHSSAPEERKTHRFNFEPVICYENEALDAAVLKLKSKSQMPDLKFPPKLVNFVKSEKNMSLYFVGHDRGKIKEFDRSKPKENLTGKMFQTLQRWSMQHPVGNRMKCPGYTGADNGSKVLFDCTFNKGASGSPGFIVSKHDHMPYVVTMLLRGYPDWYYDENVPQEEKINIPKECIFEQGVCLTEVCFDMRFRNESLAENIFGPKHHHSTQKTPEVP